MLAGGSRRDVAREGDRDEGRQVHDLAELHAGGGDRVVVETVQLLPSGWRVVRRHELKIWSHVVQGKD